MPVVCPSFTDWCENFEKIYEEICKFCKVKIADPCPEHDKAFKTSTFGKVLGIWFDSKNLKWKLPDEKIERTAMCISEILNNNEVNLLQMQKLMGRLNNVTLMCPFLKIFTKPLYSVLGHLQKNPTKTALLCSQALKDLCVFSGFLSEEDSWHPIPPRPGPPPRATIVFTSDAAGSSNNTLSKPGFASIGLDIDGCITFARQIFWSNDVLDSKTDSKGAKFGSKSTTLECLGLLLPFLSIPKNLLNQHIVLNVDNIACVFAWESGHASNDICASIRIRALHLICARIGSTVYVNHLPRLSSWEASIADRMSRSSTTTKKRPRIVRLFFICSITCMSKRLDVKSIRGLVFGGKPTG